MIDYGDFLIDEQGQLFTPAGEPLWVTQDWRYIPLTKIEDEHLAAIQGMLCGDVARWGSWIGYIDGELGRRAQLQPKNEA